MKFTCFSLLPLLLIFACSHKDSITPGWWKINRVEILKNDALTRIIDPARQYWNFCYKDSIEIFEGHELQKCLKVKMSRHSFRSIDRNTGSLVDEYIISRFNRCKLELYSNTTMEEDHYRVVYYLDKVDDTASDVPKECL